jgi:hypothetical protein
MDPWPAISHQEPGRILLRGPVLLTATFLSPSGTQPLNPRLHLPELDAVVRDIPLSPVDSEQGVYVGIVDPRWIPLDQSIEYYFTVQTKEGQTLSSELYRLTAVSGSLVDRLTRPGSHPLGRPGTEAPGRLSKGSTGVGGATQRPA